MLDFALYCKELKRKGMTKRLLWEEYHTQYQACAYGYTQFCEYYTRWLGTQKRSMRQHHIAGDKLFIDYCGPTVPIVNPDTREVRTAQIFVATLGASNYTYVEASGLNAGCRLTLMPSSSSVVCRTCSCQIISERL